MTPTPEKAATIPADVIAAAIEHTPKFVELDWPQYEAVRLSIARAIMQDRADREARPSRFGCMCQDVEIGSYDVSVRLNAPPHMQDYSANRVAAGLSPDIAVDACLVGEIRSLWSKGIRTYGCCCGHNKVRGMINVHEDDAEAMRVMGYEQWPVEKGKYPWTFYPRSIEARPSLPDSREERIREDKARPAVPIERSITDDYIFCLEDGKKFKSLKRHLMTHYNLSPEEYREKWDLPADYPMVAPTYAAARERLRRQVGIGHKTRRARQGGNNG